MTNQEVSASTVETVKGLVPTADLGQTLMHEHVFVLDQEVEQNYPGRWNEELRIRDAVQKLVDLHRVGVNTIVDLTVLGLGRNIPRVARVAAQVPVNIVVATGLYTYDDVPMFFKFRGPDRLIDGPELLEQFFVRDIVEGIADTGVRAGILKCATDQPGVTPGVERVLRAVSRAHLSTGAPITTHTHAATHRGLEQQAIFRQEGVDLTRVVIGHSGDTTNIDYLRQLMDAGSYIGMDRFGMDLLLPFDDRVNTVVQLCELGYAERMVLSHDASCFTHNVDEADKLRLMPRWNYTHIHDAVLPALRDRGVTDEDIATMLVHNPASVLGVSTG